MPHGKKKATPLGTTYTHPDMSAIATEMLSGGAD